MEEKTLWQKNKWILYLALIVVIASFILDKCNNSEVIITVPEVKGKFESQTPVHTIVKYDTIYKWSNSTTLKKDKFAQQEINRLIEENEKLVSQFSQLPDTVKIIKYAKSIEVKEFNSNLEDENIIIDISGLVSGEVKSIKSNYTIKEKKITVPIKAKIGVYLGSELGANKDLNQFTYKANLGIQNKKGTIYRASYQRIANEDFGLIGVDFKLF